MSQAALAEQTRISPPEMAQIEDGQCDPTWGQARRIASALGVLLESLAEMAEELEDKRE